MRVYKQITIASGIIAFFSFIICLVLNYIILCTNYDFWINVCLAIFGSALLTMLSSLLSYFQEKRKTLESFMTHTKRILMFLNKYDDNMSLNEKLQFFLSYHEFDNSTWDLEFGNMDFFFEHITGDRTYIYQKIYEPINEFNIAVTKHIWHFRWHLDGSATNNRVMQNFVSELEMYLLQKKEYNIPLSEQEGDIVYHKSLEIIPKLVSEIDEEFRGRFYKILYGKRIAKKMTMEATNGNGQTKNANP